MSTYTSILYQIVFSTKYREKVLRKDERQHLYAYMGGIITNKNCINHIINGTEDHLHILITLHPSIALADLVKDIKVGSSLFLKSETSMPFKAWQSGYGAFTYSMEALSNLKNYIERQEEHHKAVIFEDEYQSLLEEHGIEFDPKYLI